jgi:hypothetical protein
VPLDKSEGGVKDKSILSVFLAPLFAREVEDQDSGNLTLITCGGDLLPKIVPPTIDSAPTSTMILLCEHPAAAVAGWVGKWETSFPFSTFPPTMRDARAPNQFCGLACADQGHPRAALDANDLRIGHMGAQHPVESYG